MGDTIMVDSINELSDLAKKLNEKSDELTDTIETLNRKLTALKLGVEVWCARHPMEVGEFSAEDDEGNPCAAWAVAKLLGFAKVNEKWQLAVKDARVLQRDGCELDDYEVQYSYRSEPLLGCSREIRIAAMGVIPSLLDDLQRRANMMLQSIVEAKKRAEKL